MAKKHWVEVKETGSLLGMRFMLLVYRLFGRGVFTVFLYPVIAYYFCTNRAAREISQQYLQRIAEVEAKPRRSSFRHFLMFGEVMLDKLLAWMGQFRKEDIVLATPEVLTSMGSSAKGGVIVVSHLGNSEMCGALMDYLPRIHLTALIYNQHSSKYSGLLDEANVAAKQINFMQVTDITPATAMALAERVEAGEFIVIAGDRVPVTGDERTSTVSFLNGTAQMPQGAFILASLLKCPVYLLFCLKQSGQYHIYAEHFAERVKLPRQQRTLALNATVQRYAERLQHYCLMAPQQWFNFFPFWQDEEPSHDRS